VLPAARHELMDVQWTVVRPGQSTALVNVDNSLITAETFVRLRTSAEHLPQSTIDHLTTYLFANKQHAVVQLKIHTFTTKTLLPYFDVSILSRDLRQKKLVLIFWPSLDATISCRIEKAVRRRDSADSCPRLDS